ncbi:MAG: L-seryl-tRNA(Sec) selenium transferase, partial [Candidatus Cloacimonetes bacterium]|nr:L-seryl-tRNA(Sec) selenium transferase [Candidatus Cloacimonadota bacterium]
MADKNLRRIPGVDRVLNDPELRKLCLEYSNDLVTSVVRQTLAEIRAGVQKQSTTVPDWPGIIDSIKIRILSIGASSLKTVINATGIILHTNLSRAPLGWKLLAEITPILAGYSNLELNLETGHRGHRNDHIHRLLKFVTGAEAAAVVNNNAAAVMLCLHTLANKKEVLISRGELIEIGGSFRIPEIMKASGARMVEVGTTNRTRLSDFESAITEKTRVILKA